MGHMKKNIHFLYGFFAILVFVFVFVSRVNANEGVFHVSNKDVVCDGISVWKDDHYRIVGKCYGLKYPFLKKYDRYYLWAESSSKGVVVRVSEVNRGIFDGFANEDFGRILITAESQSNPRKPSSYKVVSGALSDFDSSVSLSTKSNTSQTNIDDSGLTKKVTTVQDKGVVSNVKTGVNSSSNVGRVVGKIFIALFIIVLVVIGMVIVGSLVFRNKGSVS